MGRFAIIKGTPQNDFIPLASRSLAKSGNRRLLSAQTANQPLSSVVVSHVAPVRTTRHRPPGFPSGQGGGSPAHTTTAGRFDPRPKLPVPPFQCPRLCSYSRGGCHRMSPVLQCSCSLL